MATNLCPWLGSVQDREIRHAEPNELHVCYAQKRPADVRLEHQAQFCLADAHQSCDFYLEPPSPAAPVAPSAPEDAEDQVGPPVSRFSLLQILLWLGVALMGVAAIVVLGSALLRPPAAVTPSAALTHTPTITRAATTNPIDTPVPPAAPASPSPSYVFAKATATPTAYPGGDIYTLAPAASAAGWVNSNEAWSNHLGDSYLYAGVYEDVIHHGVFQLDLSVVPRGAEIHSGVLELAGLDAHRLGESGVWEVRLLARDADNEWRSHTYQDIHNAQVQWTLLPPLTVDDLGVGKMNVFELTPEQLRDLEARLRDEHYTVSFRLDGPLVGENSIFAWDSGHGPASQDRPPRVLLSVGSAPQTPMPTNPVPPTNTLTPSPTPTPTDTPRWFVVTNTPTPANAVTAAAVAVQETAWAAMTGTPTPLPQFVATATPTPLPLIVVTNTPTPETRATADYLESLATANAILTGTPTPTPKNLATVTNTPLPTRTPRPTQTPILIWLDEITGTPTPTRTPTPTPMPTPAMPTVLRNKILFLSDRGEEGSVYILDPDSGRVGLLTNSWPYQWAQGQERLSPDGEYIASVGEGVRGTQIYVTQLSSGITWAVTFGTAVSYDPVWSPRGDMIAYVSQEMGPQGGSDEIFGISPQGAEKRRLTFNIWEWDKHPTFSPDGTKIVYWSNQDTGRKQLWIMNADGTEQRILLDSPYNDWDPIWVK